MQSLRGGAATVSSACLAPPYGERTLRHLFRCREASTCVVTGAPLGLELAQPSSTSLFTSLSPSVWKSSGQPRPKSLRASDNEVTKLSQSAESEVTQ